jgi:PAS domain S-box-containing protein
MMNNHKATVGKKSRKSKEEVMPDDSYLAANLFEIAQVIVLILDTNGKIVRFNPYMEELSGYRLAEVQGKDWFTTFLPERDRERIRKIFLRAVNNIQTRGNVNPILTKDRRKRMISWYDKTMKDSGGKIIGLLCVGIDITKNLAADQESRQVHKELQEGEERYSSLIESSDDPIYLVDREGKYLFANRKLLSRLGKPADEVVGRDYSQFHTSENTQEFLLKVEQVYKTGNPVSYEHTSHRDGREFIRTLSPVINPNTKDITAVTVISKDITERKLVEEALRESKSRLRTILTSAPITIFALDKQGIFTLSEGKGLEHVGLKPGENVGVSAIELYGEMLYIESTGAVISGKDIIRRALSGETISATNELRGVCFDNHIGPIRDPEGKMVGIVGVATEITKRKRAEEALSESELKFRSITEQMAEFVFVTDSQGVITYASPAATHLFGSMSVEMEGKNFTEFLAESDIPKALAAFRSALTTGVQVNNLQLEMKRKNGTTFYGELTGSQYLPTGKITGTIGIIRDITKHKRVEENLKKSELHFRNLINAAGDAIFILNINNNHLVDCNEYACRVYGYSRDEFLHMLTTDFEVKLTQSEINDVHAGFIAGKVSIIEGIHRKKDGLLFPTEIHFTIFDPATPNLIVAVVRDITKRKQAQAEIEKLAKFPDENPEPVIRLNYDGTILYANQASESLLTDWDWSRDKKVPKHWHTILTDVLEKGMDRIIEMETGKHIYSFFFVPFAEAGYVNLYGRDITELKLSEEALLKSEYMLRRLRERSEKIVDEEQRRISRIIHDDLGQTLTGLMLDMESIKQGKVPLSPNSKKVNDIIESIQFLIERTRTISTELRPPILDDLGLSAAINWKIRELKTRINILCRFKSTPRNISLDPGSNLVFFSIFKEALTNIIRHAEASKININLVQTSQATTLRIEDNGQGISAQSIEGKDSIGIYGMRINAQSIGARFKISGEPGKGTTIVVELSHVNKQIEK